METIRLIDVFGPTEIAAGKGIFQYMSQIATMPWSSIFNAADLDTDYHIGESGGKVTSPLVDNMLTNGKLNDTALTMLSNVILGRYMPRWIKRWESTLLQYNPIENYSMVEEESGSESSENANESRMSGTVTSEGKTFGFNSATGVDEGKTVQTPATTQNNEGTVDASHNRRLTRSGNIGVTTSDQMLADYRDRTLTWDLFKTVFRDVDEILTSPIYN